MYLGVKDGQLAPLKGTPNAVSTQTYQMDKRMLPIAFSGTKAEAMERMKRILAEEPRARIESETENYLHAVFTSAVFRFKDDVEFYFDEQAAVIHFRSASRLGQFDFGVNRKRMKELTKRYEEASR